MEEIIMSKDTPLTLERAKEVLVPEWEDQSMWDAWFKDQIVDDFLDYIYEHGYIIDKLGE